MVQLQYFVREFSHSLRARYWRQEDGKLALGVDRVLLLFGILLFASGIVATVAAAAGLFRIVAPLVFLVWVSCIGAIGFEVARRNVKWNGDGADLIGLCLAFLVAIMTAVFHHVFFQGQFDTAFYNSDAYLIATTGGRDLHGGPEDSLLPGFTSVGENTVRADVMFGYSSLAAYFVLLGGYWAGPLVNVPLSFLTALSLYVVGRRLSSPVGALVGVAFYELSFVTLWLSRWTMTENASTAVFWFSAVIVLKLWHHWEASLLGPLAIALAFGALARPEGIFVAGFAVLVLVANQWKILFAWVRKFSVTQPQKRRRIVAFSVLAAVGVVLAVLLPNLPAEYLKANWQNARHVLTGRVIADAPDVPTTGPSPNWGDYALRYQWDSSVAYGFHWLLLAGLLGFALGILRRRPVLIIASAALPYLAFVLMPPVTPFHPWFMRRLWIAFIPLVFLLGGGTLGAALEKGIAALPKPAHRVKGLGGTSRVVAGVVALSILLLLADQGQPFVFGREYDASPETTAWLAEKIPVGGCLLADQDVVGYGIPLRFVEERRVIPYFNALEQSFMQSFAVADAGSPCFLLTFKTALPVLALEVDENGSAAAYEKQISLSTAPRENLRPYLQSPPLEQGYAPLGDYLRRQVPPQELLDLRIHLSLIEARNPIVLLKGAEANSSDWERRDDGLHSIAANATMRIPLTSFSDLARNVTGLTVVVVQNAMDAQLGVWIGGEFRLPDSSQGSDDGNLTLHRFRLAPRVGVDTIGFPKDTALRGVMVA